MNKTLHKKLTDKHVFGHTATLAYASGEHLPTVFIHEMKMLKDAAGDLLQPRPEAIARLLELAKGLN
jgi:hypothetical protein